MVRRLGLGKNNHLTYDSLALNPRYILRDCIPCNDPWLVNKRHILSYLDVVSTLMRRCINVTCPLGRIRTGTNLQVLNWKNILSSQRPDFCDVCRRWFTYLVVLEYSWNSLWKWLQFHGRRLYQNMFAFLLKTGSTLKGIKFFPFKVDPFSERARCVVKQTGSHERRLPRK